MNHNRTLIASSLRDVIDRWLDDHAEEEIFQAELGWCGADTSEHMANAAVSVMFAAADIQGWLVDEGYMAETDDLTGKSKAVQS